MRIHKTMVRKARSGEGFIYPFCLKGTVADLLEKITNVSAIVIGDFSNPSSPNEGSDCGYKLLNMSDLYEPEVGFEKPLQTLQIAKTQQGALTIRHYFGFPWAKLQSEFCVKNKEFL